MATIERMYLTVDVDDSTQWATVYRAGTTPDNAEVVGTLSRKRIFESGPEWTISYKDGTVLKQTCNVRTCLRYLQYHLDSLAAEA